MKALIASVVTLGAVLSLFAVQAFAAGKTAEGGDRVEQAFVLYLPNTVDKQAAVIPADGSTIHEAR